MKYIARFSTLFLVWSDLIRSVQNGSNLIKMYHLIFKFYFFDQNGSDLSKMDQTWSNWISDEIIIEIYYQIFNFIYFLIRLNQICQKWIKMDQIRFLMKYSLKYIIRFLTLSIFWSDLIRSFQNCQLDQYNQICNFYQFYIFHFSIFFNQF